MNTKPKKNKKQTKPRHDPTQRHAIIAAANIGPQLDRIEQKIGAILSILQPAPKTQKPFNSADFVKGTSEVEKPFEPDRLDPEQFA